MLKKDPEDLAAGSIPALPASSVMAAMIADQTEPRALCAIMASRIVADGTSCSRGALAAAFDDLTLIDCDAVHDVLRGKTC
jgi:hypothetical protein